MPKSLVPINFLGGVNQFDHRRAIQDNEAVSLKNLVPTASGLLRKRRATSKKDHVYLAEATAILVNFITAPFDTSNYQYIQIIRGSIATVNHMISVRGGGMGEITQNLFHAQNWRPQIVTFGKDVYVFPGKRDAVNYNFAMSVINDGATAITNKNFNGANNGTLDIKCACVYLSRMVYAFRNNGYEDCIVLSDRKDPLTIGDAALRTDAGADGSRYLKFPGMNGDKITVMCEITMSDARNVKTNALLVLGKRVAFVCTGQTEQSTYTDQDYDGNFDYSRVNYQCGCASAETLVHTPFGTLWASEDDVWLMSGNQLPIGIGKKIRNQLKFTSELYHYRWSATYHDGFYRLLIFDSTQGGGNHTGVLKGEWWLDLREGPPQNWRQARWFGPVVINKKVTYGEAYAQAGSFFLAAENRPSTERAAYSLVLGGDSHDTITAIRTDYAETAFDDLGYAGTNVKGGNEVTVEVVTKEYDYGDPMVDKIHEGVEANISNDDGMRVGIDYTVDQVLQDNELVNIPKVTTGTEEFQSIILDPDPDKRIVGKTHQLRIYDVAGYVVSDQNDRVQFNILGQVFTATLTQGFYADAKAFLDHLMVRMNAAALAGGFSQTFTHNQAAPGANQYVEITISNSTWRHQNYLGVDAELEAESVKVWGDLGFDTSVPDPADATTKAATSRIVLRRSPKVLIAGIVSRIYNFFRRPTKASERGG